MNESTISITFTEKRDHFETTVEANGAFSLKDFSILLTDCSKAFDISSAELKLIAGLAAINLNREHNDE